MTSRRPIAQSLRQRTRQRANHLCEYCHTSEQWQYTLFTIDHIIPIAMGGTNSFDNLALACAHCNRRKSQLVSAVDSQSRDEVMLFNVEEKEE